MRRVHTFVPIESEIERVIPELATGSSKRDVEKEIDHESSKRQKIGESSEPVEEPKDKEEELSQEKLQQMMIIVLEQGMSVEALQTKYLIIDWEIYTKGPRKYWKIIRVGNNTKIMRCPKNFLGRYSCRLKDQEDEVFGRILSENKKIYKEERKSYYQIIRADGKSQMYMIFSQMLKSFDREDLVDLYKLVKAKYESTRPVGDLDLLLWGDLKTMFEPHVEDKIYMLVEKKYPLTPSTLSMMLEKKLMIDYESEMAYQLLKFIMKQLKK
ncbi:hypothetical protein Tco_1531473 [Tanacetum coccineum]